MTLRVVPKAWVGATRTHRALDLGSITFQELFTRWAEDYHECRYAVVLVGTDYWMIDIYTSQTINQETGIGDYWVFPTEEAAVMAANIIYGSEGLM